MNEGMQVFRRNATCLASLMTEGELEPHNGLWKTDHG